jgi:hypothetical protein
VVGGSVVGWSVVGWSVVGWSVHLSLFVCDAMDRTTLALALSLLSASWAAAQIPQDPFTAPTASAQSAEPAAGKSQPFVTRQSDVEIPFNVRPGATPETQPTAVRIFVSWDQGQSWHFYDERRPEEGRFRFRARQDGEFWFATQTIDRSGKPDNAKPNAPQLKLVIDTQRPQLLVQAQVDGSSNVNLALSAADASLAPTTLKVEYQDAAGTGGNWQLVDVRTNGATPAQLTAQSTFRPNVAGRSINLRAEVADAAGNIAYYSQRLSLNPPPRPPAAAAYSPPADPSATPWPSNASAGASADIAAGRPPASEQVQIPNVVSNPFLGPGRLASGRPTAPSPGTLPPPSAPADTLPPPAGPPTFAPAADDREFVIPRSAADSLPSPSAPGPTFSQPPASAYSPALPQPGSPPPSSAPPPSALEIMPSPEPAPPPARSEHVAAPDGQRPRLTNSRRFSLEYDVETVGPEGLQAVELWGTTDGGRNWVKWGTDPDKTSPFDVEVNSEAIYGFRIVIVGRNGLATSSPKPGEAADIWVGVDLTRPAARLIGAAYGQGPAAGKLDIRWEASDVNLGTRPISLAIGERSDGPFTPLAAGLPNSGQYLWEFDPRSPRQIYLRLEVRDEAGNVAVDQLTDPIKVEGLEPKGRIRSFNPGPEPIEGAFRTPLFR